ncbi:4-coumarate--CoA ligase 1 [Neocucurbitaria cava]|uniref:4-coumarate--CoA ligase 1 n=1 Tax=Neocucurbitaria cava TaxID=798079 RepID=A0A9W9CLZ7_9PLEO|nr:4-coumarate--CoA ligase 1 [Neocucurbitaria cava]
MHYFSICKPKLVAIDPSLYASVSEALSNIPSLRKVPIISLIGGHPRLKNVSQWVEAMIAIKTKGLNVVGLLSVWLGSYTKLMKKYSLDQLLRLSSLCMANTLRIVPSIALAMTKTEMLDDYDLRNIKFIMCAGAALQPEVIQVLQKQFNQAPIFQGYG